jgi:excisionase family DNA binding protein
MNRLRNGYLKAIDYWSILPVDAMERKRSIATKEDGSMEQIERLAFTVGEFAVATGLSRSKTYEMVKTQEIPSITLGGRTLIPADAARRKFAELTQTRSK